MFVFMTNFKIDRVTQKVITEVALTLNIEESDVIKIINDYLKSIKTIMSRVIGTDENVEYIKIPFFGKFFISGWKLLRRDEYNLEHKYKDNIKIDFYKITFNTK